MSSISRRLPLICEKRFHILGDGAYEIREYLLTPYRNYENLSRQKQKYNDKFCATRVVIESAFGILKGRFRQLLRVELQDVDRITKLIMSCCVLHNICLDAHDELSSEEVCTNSSQNQQAEVNKYRAERPVHLKRLGEIKRDAICNSF